MTHAGNKTTLLAYDFEARELVIADPLPMYIFTGKYLTDRLSQLLPGYGKSN
jgi:hypothetical protein